MSVSTVLYALMAGITPSLIWLYFWTREDNHPEPKHLLAACFLGGMLAVVFAIFGEKYIYDSIKDPENRYIIWAILEELLKFITVIAITIKSKYNDEPIDMMIYCITVALGFSALENTFFIMGPLANGQVVQSIITGNMRFIGATLVHVVSSSLIGFSLGYAFYRGWFAKFIYSVIGLGMAISLHAAFNLSIINIGSDNILKTFIWIWITVVIMIILFEEIKAVGPSKPNKLFN